MFLFHKSVEQYIDDLKLLTSSVYISEGVYLMKKTFHKRQNSYRKMT